MSDTIRMRRLKQQIAEKAMADKKIIEGLWEKRIKQDNEDLKKMYEEVTKMSDLIERQTVIDEIKSHYRMHDNDLLELIVYKIENMPSVQPVIILCKDCVHHGYEGHIPYCDIKDYGYGWEDDDFCSYAERREEP